MNQQQHDLFSRGAGAIVSSCGRYRHLLTRDLGVGDGELLVVMLNPSTADAQVDDATIRWDHAVALGAPWHWVMDDNIHLFARVHENRKIRLGDGTGFRAMEDWCLQYRNIAMAGPNYWMFVPRKQQVPPLAFNTRIYSCNLIRNDVPFRWRGRYNEDTDLSLVMLKAKWATVQFNAFVQLKAPTQSVKGGNTADFYAREGTLPKSAMLVRMHPDVARLSWRFHRAHHYVDYTPFRGNPLLRDPAAAPLPDYGFNLVDLVVEDPSASPESDR